MKTIFEIVCDTKEEADFAVAYCEQKGWQNITVKPAQQIHVVEVEGTSPNYVFAGKYSRMSQALWIVTGEM